MGNTIVPPPVNMNLLTQSPGLRHLAETIFMILSPEDLLFKCQDVNDQWRSIARNPLIWLKICEGLTKEKSVSKSTRKLIEGYYNLCLADELTQILIKIYLTSKDSQEPIHRESIEKLIYDFVYKQYPLCISLFMA